MKRYLLCFSILLILLFHVKLLLPDEKEKEFLKKYTKKVDLENLKEFKNLDFKLMSTSNKKIPYKYTVIDKSIKKHGLPTSYNFIDEKGAPNIITDQGNCGCCWAMATTTALSYRYFKKGITVDLSPQYTLSCFHKTCKSGLDQFSASLNLIKNGTVTKTCFPFHSVNDNIMPECPTSCEDNKDNGKKEEFKKYMAKNLYTTLNDDIEKDFYDIVIMIMDQLIKNGPVVSSIFIYDDFRKWVHKKESFGEKVCSEEIYSYDGFSGNEGYHAVVITGYGKIGTKYYWLIQNSWGEAFCDNSFTKIEFGQIGIERVSFFEPQNVSKIFESPKKISLEFKNISNDNCSLDIAVLNNGEDDWKDTVEIKLQNSDNHKYFSYFCGLNTVKIKGRDIKKINCHYSKKNLDSYEGIYRYMGYNSLGEENIFNLDDSFNKAYLHFYGNNLISYMDSSNTPFYHISEEGSIICFKYNNSEYTKLTTKFYLEFGKDKIELSNCKINEMANWDKFIYCNITKDEIKSFKEKVGQSLKSSLIYGANCHTIKSEISIYLLNTTINPVFRIKHFSILNQQPLDDIILAVLSADIEGNITNYWKNENKFYTLIRIKKDNKNETFIMECSTELSSNTTKNYLITGIIRNPKRIKYNHKNSEFYLLPYYYIDQKNPQDAFEIIINKEMKSEGNMKSSSSFYYFKYLYLLIILLLI